MLVSIINKNNSMTKGICILFLSPAFIPQNKAICSSATLHIGNIYWPVTFQEERFTTWSRSRSYNSDKVVHTMVIYRRSFQLGKLPLQGYGCSDLFIKLIRDEKRLDIFCPIFQNASIMRFDILMLLFSNGV